MSKYFAGWNGSIQHHTEVNDTELQKDLKEDIASIPGVEGIFYNKNSGYRMRYESLGIFFNGPWRITTPAQSEAMCKKIPSRCKPIKGAGTMRRCPNNDRGCQFFFNYQKFLQCYNKFEHLGHETSLDKCGFFLSSIPPSVLEFYENIREEGDWLGIKSNYKPASDGEEDDEEDF